MAKKSKLEKASLDYNTRRFDAKKAAKRVQSIKKATRSHAHKFVVRKFSKIAEVRRNVMLWMVVIFAVIGAVFVQSQLTNNQYITDAKARGGVYIEGVVGKIETLNPLYATSAPELAARKLLFSTLYSYDNLGMLRSDVADTLKATDDGLTYTITLQKNVRWHDGQKLTARDIAQTIALIQNQKTRSPLYSSWRTIKVKVVNEYTVKFVLPAPYASFKHALTFPILPAHIVADIDPALMRESGFSYAPIGSGPFKFRNLQSTDDASTGRVVQMVMFDQYHRGKAYLDRFELRTYKDMKTLERAYDNAELNGAADVSFDANVFDNERKRRIVSPINNGVYALLNNNNIYLKDKNIRKALQLGIDVDRVRKALEMQVDGVDLPFIAAQVSTEKISRPKVDIKKAQQMLAKAGWKNKDGTLYNKDQQKMTIKVTTTNGAVIERAAKNIVTQLVELGVDASLDVIDTREPGANFISNTLQPRAFDILVYELAIGGDPDVFAYWHSSQSTLAGYNFSGYENAVADAALASARERLDVKLRNAKYATFARQWLADAPAIGLYRANTIYAQYGSAQSVKDGSVFVSPVNRYSDILEWSVETHPVYKTP